MEVLVTYLVICALPAAGFYAFERAVAWFGRPQPLRPRRRSVPLATGPSLERLVGDLRRLEEEYRHVEGSTVAAKAHRLRVLSLAYDETLRDCCRALDLPLPPRTTRTPMGSWDRVQTELELARHGLTW